MLTLGVNIDHVATLREARYKDKLDAEPSVVHAALVAEKAGAHGITAHLREDRRHIQERDLWSLKESIKTRLNLEMANTPAIVELALKLKPFVVCIVPEKRQELTTEGGLDVAAHWKELAKTRRIMSEAGILVSLFVDPDQKQIEAASRVGAEFVELHTGAFAALFSSGGDWGHELEKLVKSAALGKESGLRINAGHGLNYQNVHQMHLVPHLEELNIGHSIVSRALFAGMESAVTEMLARMEAVPARI